MLLAMFYVGVLVWALICALAALVAGDSVGARTGYVKRALVGVGVGAVFGIANIYLAGLLGAVNDLFASLAPAQLDRFTSSIITRALLTTGAATLTAIAVGALTTKSAFAMLKCAIVGAAFGLVIGIANAAVVLIALYAVIPAMEAAGLDRSSRVLFAAAVMVSGAVIDIAVAVIALRMLRAWRTAASPANTA